MIRVQETLACVLDSVSHFVRNRLLPSEQYAERVVRLFRMYASNTQIRQLVITRNLIKGVTQ